LGIDLERSQAQGDAHRRGIGEAALAALVGVILRLFELIMVEVEVRRAGEVDDREHRAQGLLEARDIARLGVRAEELLVALALNLDEVRHFRDFVDIAENLADSARVGLQSAGGLTGCVDRFGGHVLPCAKRRRMDAPPLGGPLSGRLWSAAPLPSPMRSVRAPFGPCPGEDGKSPGRTTRCGQSRYVWISPI